jgi:glycine cleavage system aminomethyltransferase T
MLPIEHVVMGTEVEVDAPHGRKRGVVVPKPFYDPAKEDPKT